MTPAARVAAAIEVLADVEARRRPAVDALKDWGLARRFAGSGDRAAIAGLVYDALRRKSSSAWLMDEASPRAVTIGALKQLRDLDEAAIAALFSGEGHAPPPLTEAERERLRSGDLSGAPDPVRGDYPEWLAAAFAESCGDDAVEEGKALASRAPIDLRVNMLKGGRDRALAALAHLDAQPTPLSPVGLRVAVRADGRGPALSAEPAYVKGAVEVQDEGSQLASLLTGAKPEMQVLDSLRRRRRQDARARRDDGEPRPDLRHDDDGRRLTPIFDRLARAGARNVQVRAPRGSRDILSDLAGRCDVVLIDAPCTGSGAWRRNPDAKWRVRPGALEQRIKDQNETLERAAGYVKPGGHLVYVTCSLLKAENEDRIAAFLAAHDAFLPLEAAHWAAVCGLPALAAQASALGVGFRFSPLRTGTDGFYVAPLTRSA